MFADHISHQWSLVLRKIKELVQRIGNNIFSMTDEDFNKTFVDLVGTKLNSSNMEHVLVQLEGRQEGNLGRGIVTGVDRSKFPKTCSICSSFGIEPEHGDWSLLRNHILNMVLWTEITMIICGQMDGLCCSAPNGNNPYVGCLRGAQGEGRVTRTFGKFFGKHFVHIANGDQLTGRFNASLATSCAVFFDEAL